MTLLDAYKQLHDDLSEILETPGNGLSEEDQKKLADQLEAIGSTYPEGDQGDARVGFTDVLRNCFPWLGCPEDHDLNGADVIDRLSEIYRANNGPQTSIYCPEHKLKLTCPDCGSTNIGVKVEFRDLVLVNTDRGDTPFTFASSEAEYDKHSPAYCQECDREGDVKDF